MRRTINGVAAILAATLFCLLVPLLPASHDGVGLPEGFLSDKACEAVARAPWIERRGYPDIEDAATRIGRVREDLLFDAWLADRGRKAGLSLDEGLSRKIDEHRDLLLRQAASRLLAETHRTTLTDAQIAVHAKGMGFDRMSPEMHVVSYIHIDDTRAASDEERSRIASRAEEIARGVNASNFQDMARTWSDAPSAAAGGLLGSVDTLDLGPTFAEHIKKTKPGEIGGPYRTKSGWNIVWVQSVSPPRRIVEPADVSQAVANRLARMDLDRMEEEGGYKEFLASSGLTGASSVANEILAFENYLLGRAFVAHESGNDKAAPTDEELTDLYKEYAAVYRAPTRYHAREIVLTSPEWNTDETRTGWEKRRDVRDRARALREDLLKGGDFAAAARSQSTAPTAAEGGDLGWIQPPTSATLDNALIALEPGGISPPLLRRDGYWLIKLEGAEGVPVPPMDQLRGELTSIWQARRIKATREKLHQEFKPGGEAN